MVSLIVRTDPSIIKNITLSREGGPPNPSG
jgi:hypothetical protein